MKMRFIVLSALLLCAAVASADMVTTAGVGVMWGENGTGNTWMNQNGFVDNGDDSFTMEDNWNVPDNCMFSMSMTYDPDPFVNAAFSVTNNSGVDQTFTFTYTAPVVPAIMPSTLYGGSMSGSASADVTAGSVSTAGVPLYQGLIDGTSVLDLYTDPTVWNAAAGQSINILAQGSPLTNLGPAAMTSISMVYKFTLTPGETATMNGIFAVVPVPEPATMMLLGIGGLLMRKRR